MLEFDSVSKKFGDKIVLNNLSLKIKKGEHVALMGGSGIGKTTVANLILGLLTPDAGKIILDFPKGISAVFQEERLLEWYSAKKNIEIINPAAAEKLLNRLLLADCVNKNVLELSGGMRRRVSLARALAFEHEFLVLDEPFKGLDADTKKAVIQVISQETTNKTLLLITHETAEASALCDRFIEI